MFCLNHQQHSGKINLAKLCSLKRARDKKKQVSLRQICLNAITVFMPTNQKDLFNQSSLHIQFSAIYAMRNL